MWLRSKNLNDKSGVSLFFDIQSIVVNNKVREVKFWQTSKACVAMQGSRVFVDVKAIKWAVFQQNIRLKKERNNRVLKR